MTNPASQAHTAARIDPKLTLGEVALTVHDLDLIVGFYQQVLGLRLLAREGTRAVLSTPDGHPLVTLRQNLQAPIAPGNSTGLYQLAIAFPTRPDLARWLRPAPAEPSSANAKVHPCGTRVLPRTIW
ncbi:VOC family protein [Deinococcus peraridilitoris]|uniref:VOC family protein n=1 Tax=Deinococcus peraridilitoris TaxID=432329 RepID=UPI00031AE3F6|nr:VOC family protein [Deinococcus peraridilitoris]